jgi:uncharacterized GH25 family protein
MSTAALVETPEVQSARTALQEASMDVVAIAAPRRVKAGDDLPTLAVTVNRQGAPVPDATVYVQITTSRRGGNRASQTVTVPVTTGADGTAALTMPKAVAGVPGSRTVVQAFTNEGRAIGAKGVVAVGSTRKRMVWAR